MENAMEFFEARARSARSPAEIDEFLKFLPPMPRYTAIRIYILYCPTELGQFFTSAARRIDGLRVVNADAGAFEYQRRYGRKRIRTVRGTFVILPSTQNRVYRLLSVCGSDFWNDGVRYLVRHQYPKVVPLFLKQGELRKALRELRDRLGIEYRLMASEMSLKERRPPSETRRGLTEQDSARWWTDRGVEEVFDEAQERGQWFTSIAFKVERWHKRRERHVEAASCRLYKYGYLQYDYLHSEFTQKLLPSLEKAASDRVELFRNRGIRERKERGYAPSVPLEITYPVPVFEDSDGLKRLESTVMTYSNATKALFHSNPYFHASVADVSDGSSFEIWVLSPNRILVVPQGRSSPPALERLVSHIFSDFREGEVAEYSGE